MPDDGEMLQANRYQRFYKVGTEFRPANSDRYPFHMMQVGESFFVPEADASRRKVTQAAYYYAKKIGNGWKFAVRAVTGGTACIRIA